MILGAGIASQEVPFLIAALIAGIWAALILIRQSFKLSRAFGHGAGFGLFLLLFDRLGRVILGLGKSRYVGKGN